MGAPESLPSSNPKGISNPVNLREMEICTARNKNQRLEVRDVLDFSWEIKSPTGDKSLQK